MSEFLLQYGVLKSILIIISSTPEAEEVGQCSSLNFLASLDLWLFTYRISFAPYFYIFKAPNLTIHYSPSPAQTNIMSIVSGLGGFQNSSNRTLCVLHPATVIFTELLRKPKCVLVQTCDHRGIEVAGLSSMGTVTVTVTVKVWVKVHVKVKVKVKVTVLMTL